MSEKASYRENLAMLSEKCGDKQILSLPEASKALGLDERTTLKYFRKFFISLGDKRKKQYISVPDLARAISS